MSPHSRMDLRRSVCNVEMLNRYRGVALDRARAHTTTRAHARARPRTNEAIARATIRAIEREPRANATEPRDERAHSRRAL